MRYFRSLAPCVAVVFHEITTNDLCGFAASRLDEIQRPANVHFTPDGSRALAEEVTRNLRDALPE